MEVTGSLKQQFEELQEKQQKKLQRRKQLKEEKNQTPGRTLDSAFGVSDDLDLKLADPLVRQNATLSEELVDHLNDQIRELKDETGRLYKLLSERDLELRHVRKKLQDRSVSETSTPGGIGSDTAALKIVELSKKVRELTAELESERTKSKQLAQKCLKLENELQHQVTNNKSNGTSSGGKAYLMQDIEDKQTLEANLKLAQEKLKQAEMKATEYRNESQSLRQELKIAHKVIVQEVGEGATVQSLLNGSSNWRGRAQQIITLQKKVNELRSQLDYYSNMAQTGPTGNDLLNSASARTTRLTAEEKHKEQLRKIEKERKEAQEKMVMEFKALEQDYESLKTKLDASKARNKILSTELKTVKQQMQKLLEKGRHDDELIEALLKQQTKLKTALEEATKNQKMTNKEKEEATKQLTIKTQQENNLIEQLRMIIAEKEAQIKTLEMGIKQNKNPQLNANVPFDEESTELNNMTPNQPTSSSVVNQEPNKRNSAPNQELEVKSSSHSSTLTGRPSNVGFEVNGFYENVTPLPSSRSVNSSVWAARENTDVGSRPSSGKQHSARNSSRTRKPTSANRSDKVSSEDLEAVCQQYKSLYQAVSVERDRLTELIKVLQTRIDEATQKLTDTQSQLAAQRRRNVQLEKQVGKLRTELGASAKKSKVKMGNSSNDLRDSVAEDDLQIKSLEEVETNLAIQRDENEALKAALQSTLQSKEEDLRLYTEMIEETKKIFLQGLRQYRGQSANV